MLDDDDYYLLDYIQSVVDNFTKFPETAFMITKSTYKNHFLPRTRVSEIYYNNYIPKPCDSVRSSSVHNINIIGDIVLNLWKELTEEITRMDVSSKKWKLFPADAKLLGLIGAKVKSGELKSLYIPTRLVGKLTYCNWNNIK